MNVTFDEAVPEAARKGLEWFASRAYSVGMPVKRLTTCRPEVDKNSRVRRPEDKIIYLFTMDDEGDIHVTVGF